jgi:hypothetical protein
MFSYLQLTLAASTIVQRNGRPPATSDVNRTCDAPILLLSQKRERVTFPFPFFGFVDGTIHCPTPIPRFLQT